MCILLWDRLWRRSPIEEKSPDFRSTRSRRLMMIRSFLDLWQVIWHSYNILSRRNRSMVILPWDTLGQIWSSHLHGQKHYNYLRSNDIEVKAIQLGRDHQYLSSISMPTLRDRFRWRSFSQNHLNVTIPPIITPSSLPLQVEAGGNNLNRLTSLIIINVVINPNDNPSNSNNPTSNTRVCRSLATLLAILWDRILTLLSSQVWWTCRTRVNAQRIASSASHSGQCYSLWLSNVC